MRSIWRYLLSVLLLLGGCYDRSKEGGTDLVLPRANASLTSLRTLASGGCHEICYDIVCAGRVTTSTRDGNFYRTLYIEDESGGAELLLGLYDMDTLYPEGLYVVLKLNGLAVDVRNGVVRVGLPPTSHDDSLREMESRVVIDRHLLRSESVESVEPMECEIGELKESMCGRLVRIAGLRYSPPVEMERTTLLGECPFANSDGTVIYSRVSEYANFATEPIPDGEVAICGILSYEHIGEISCHSFVVVPRRYADYFTARNTSTSSCQNLSTVAISKRSSGE
jgi:hypothetical protein